MVNAASSNSKAVSSVVSPCNVVFTGRSKMSGSSSMVTKPVPDPKRGRKPKEPSTSDVIVEFVAFVSKQSSAILRVVG